MRKINNLYNELKIDQWRDGLWCYMAIKDYQVQV